MLTHHDSSVHSTLSVELEQASGSVGISISQLTKVPTLLRPVYVQWKEEGL